MKIQLCKEIAVPTLLDRKARCQRMFKNTSGENGLCRFRMCEGRCVMLVQSTHKTPSKEEDYTGSLLETQRSGAVQFAYSLNGKAKDEEYIKLSLIHI